MLDKADAIAALPESVKAYFRMHGRVSNCDIRWYMKRFPAFNKLEDSERRAIADNRAAGFSLRVWQPSSSLPPVVRSSRPGACPRAEQSAQQQLAL